MELTIADEKRYVPDFNDNLKIPEPEQIVVTVRVPPAKEQKFIYRTGTNGLEFDFPLAISRFVTKVENLSVTNQNGITTKVTTGKQLTDIPGLSLLVDDIGGEILSLMREIDSDPT